MSTLKKENPIKKETDPPSTVQGPNLTPDQLHEIKTGITRLPEKAHNKLIKELENTQAITIMKNELKKYPEEYKFISMHLHDTYPVPNKAGECPLTLTVHTAMPILVSRKAGWVAQDMHLIAEVSKRTMGKNKNQRANEFLKVLQQVNKVISRKTIKHAEGTPYPVSLLMDRQERFSINGHEHLMRYHKKDTPVQEVFPSMKLPTPPSPLPQSFPKPVVDVKPKENPK